MSKIQEVDMTKVVAMASKFASIDELKKEFKRVASIKCRLLKQKAKKSYQADITKVTNYEQMLKEVRKYLVPEEKTVTTMSAEDISLLNFDQTMRAIKSIQSKKCNTQYLTADKATNVEYQDACRIEQLLLAHKATVKPIEETVIKKSDLSNLIDQATNLEDLSKQELIDMMQAMLSK